MATRYLTPDGQEAHSTIDRNDAYPYVCYRNTELNDPDECFDCSVCGKNQKGGDIWLCALGTAMCNECMIDSVDLFAPQHEPFMLRLLDAWRHGYYVLDRPVTA